MEKVKLKEIASIIAGQSPPSTTYNKIGEGMPFFQGKSDFGNKYPDAKNWCTSPTKVAEPNDILMSVRAPVGSVNICNVQSCIGRGIGAIRANAHTYYEYLYYYLKEHQRDIARFAVGSTFTAITQKDISNIEIVKTSLSTQIRIAKVLSWVEELIEDRRKSIDMLDDLLRSTFLEMFGDPEINEKGWRKENVGNIADSIVPGRDKPKSFTGNIPWINTADLQNLSFIENSQSDIGLTADEIDTVKAKIIPVNSILMTCVGDLGVVSICKKEVVINQQLHSFLCRENVNNIFVMFCLYFQKGFMYKMATTTTVPYMNKTTCNSIPIIIPPLLLQNQFAEIVGRVEATKKDYKKSLKELENLYASLSQRAFNDDLNLDKLDVQKELEEHREKIGQPKEEESNIENKSKVALHTITSGLSVAFAEYGKLYETIEKLPKLPLSGLEAAIAAQDTLKNISETVTLDGITSAVDSIVELQKYNERLNQSISPFLPSSSLAFLVEAQRNINKIIDREVHERVFLTPQEVINTIVETWEGTDISFNTQRIAKILKDNFTGFHFNFEMALNCIKNNFDEATYYSTEELLKEPAKTTDFDLNKIFTYALLGENTYLRLKQHFYNAEEENFNLQLRNEDYESFKYHNKKDRSGIYFSIE